MTSVQAAKGGPALWRLMRPYQWTKNGFVLTGLLFDPLNWTPDTGLRVLLLTAAFALASSGVYILNDLADQERDRAHPVKCRRPVASGEVSAPQAKLLLTCCWLAAAALALSQSVTGLALIAGYVLTNLAYSWKLKHEVIVDVFILASGFVLRVLVGTVAVGIAPSQWLILTTICISLFLGFTKRRTEVVRRELVGDVEGMLYQRAVLDQAVTISASGTVLMYALYTVAPSTVTKHGENLIYTVPIVMFGMFRYLHTVQLSAGLSDPSDVLLKDRYVQGTVVLWASAVAAILWLT